MTVTKWQPLAVVEGQGVARTEDRPGQMSMFP